MTLNSLPPELKLAILSATTELDLKTLLSISSVNRSFHCLFKSSAASLIFTAITREFPAYILHPTLWRSSYIPAQWLYVVLAVNRATYNRSTNFKTCTPITGTKAAEVIHDVLDGKGNFKLSRESFQAMRNLYGALLLDTIQPDEDTVLEILAWAIRGHCVSTWTDSDSERIEGYEQLSEAMKRLWDKTPARRTLTWNEFFYGYFKETHNNRFGGWTDTVALRIAVLYEMEREMPLCWWLTWWLYGTGDLHDAGSFSEMALPRRFVQDIEQAETKRAPPAVEVGLLPECSENLSRTLRRRLDLLPRIGSTWTWAWNRKSSS